MISWLRGIGMIITIMSVWLFEIRKLNFFAPYLFWIPLFSGSVLIQILKVSTSFPLLWLLTWFFNLGLTIGKVGSYLCNRWRNISHMECLDSYLVHLHSITAKNLALRNSTLPWFWHNIRLPNRTVRDFPNDFLIFFSTHLKQY